MQREHVLIGLRTCPPDKSTTANFPSEMAFSPLFHHLSRSSRVLTSTVETLDSGTGSTAGKNAPNCLQELITGKRKRSPFEIQRRAIEIPPRKHRRRQIELTLRSK